MFITRLTPKDNRDCAMPKMLTDETWYSYVTLPQVNLFFLFLSTNNNSREDNLWSIALRRKAVKASEGFSNQGVQSHRSFSDDEKIWTKCNNTQKIMAIVYRAWALAHAL
eukprot:349939-Pelagomonas_calceolata.AAC.1